jgi:phage/conjugal plasmid C-4 type zinc finger TraR family protein
MIVMDHADLADQYLEDYLERAISAARSAHQNIERPSPSAINCVDCDDKIPAGRRSAIIGCKRCVSCQADLEKRARCYSGEAPASAIEEDQLDRLLDALS